MKDSDVSATNGSSASGDGSDDAWDSPFPDPSPAGSSVSPAAEGGAAPPRVLGPLLSLPDDFWSADEADAAPLPPGQAALDEPWPTVDTAPPEPDPPGRPDEAAPTERSPLLELPEDFWAGDEVRPVDRRGRTSATPTRSPAPPAPPGPPGPPGVPATGTVPLARPRPTLVPAASAPPVRSRRMVGILALVATAAVVTAVILAGGSDGDGARQLDAALPPSTVATPRLVTSTIPRALPLTGATTSSVPGPVPTTGPAGTGTNPRAAGAGTGKVPDEAVGGADGDRAGAFGGDADPQDDDGAVDEPVTPADPPARRRDTTPATTAPPATGPPPAGNLTRLPGVEQEVLALTNADRASNGRPPVSRNGCMDSEASAWAKSMAESTAMAHSADGGSAVQGCRGAGAYWGDNIGHWQPCYASEMEEWWMGSPSHRPHILDANFTVVGIGVWAEPSGRCWFQVYFGS